MDGNHNEVMQETAELCIGNNILHNEIYRNNMEYSSESKLFFHHLQMITHIGTI